MVWKYSNHYLDLDDNKKRNYNAKKANFHSISHTLNRCYGVENRNSNNAYVKRSKNICIKKNSSAFSSTANIRNSHKTSF